MPTRSRGALPISALRLQSARPGRARRRCRSLLRGRWRHAAKARARFQNTRRLKSSVTSCTCERSTPRAKALSFHFFFNDLIRTSLTSLSGRTRAQALIRPVISSQARRAKSRGCRRSTPVPAVLWARTALTTPSSQPRSRSMGAPSRGCCSRVGWISQSKSWSSPANPHSAGSPSSRCAYQRMAASTASIWRRKPGATTYSVIRAKASFRSIDAPAAILASNRLHLLGCFPRRPVRGIPTFGGLGSKGGAPRDILVLLAVLFLTFSLQFFDPTRFLPDLLRLTPSVWSGLQVWRLLTYPFRR